MSLLTRKNRRIILIILGVALLGFLPYKVYQAEKDIYSQINQNLAPTDSTSGFTVEKTEISIFRGSLTLQNLNRYPAAGQPPVKLGKIEISTGKVNTILVAVLPVRYLQAYLNNFKATIENLELPDADQKADRIQISQAGNTIAMIQSLTYLRLPLSTQILELDISPFQISDYRSDTLSVVFKYDEPGRIIDIIVNHFGIGGFDIIGNIQIEYGKEVFLYKALNIGAEFSALPQPGTDLNLGSNTGRISFQNASASILAEPAGDSIRFNTDWLLNHTNLAVIKIEMPVFYPAPGFMTDLRNFLEIFGVPPHAYSFTTFYLELIPGNSEWHLKKMKFESPHLDLEFQGSVNFYYNPSDPFISGSIRLSEMSDPVRNFIDNLEHLSGNYFRRDGNDIILPVSGPLSRLSQELQPF